MGLCLFLIDLGIIPNSSHFTQIIQRKERQNDGIQNTKWCFSVPISQNADYAFEFAYGIVKRDEGLLFTPHVRHENPHQAFAEGLLRKQDTEKIQENH